MLLITEHLLQQATSQPQRVTLRGIGTWGWILLCRRAQQVLDCPLLQSNRVIDIFTDWLRRLVSSKLGLSQTLTSIMVWGRRVCVCGGGVAVAQNRPWLLCNLPPLNPLWIRCSHPSQAHSLPSLLVGMGWAELWEIKVTLGSGVEHTITILNGSDNIWSTKKNIIQLGVSSKLWCPIWSNNNISLSYPHLFCSTQNAFVLKEFHFL